MDSQGNRAKTVPPTEVEGRPPSSPSRRLRSVPPLDPTVAPASVSRLPVRASGVAEARPVARPILASECLKDDIAPLEPMPHIVRGVLATSGVVAIAGAAILLKSSAMVSIAAFVGGAVTAVAAALPSYRFRAALGFGGAAVTVLAILSGESSWALRALTAIVLASALFMRACYRANRAVRVAIGVGIALFVAAAAMSFGAHLSSRITAGLMVAVALASFLGFMGEQTTGGAAWWGALSLLTAGASIAVVAPVGLVPLSAVGVLVVASVAAAASAFALGASVIAPGERAREHRASLADPRSGNNIDND